MDYQEIKRDADFTRNMKSWCRVALAACVLNVIVVLVSAGLCWGNPDKVAIVVCAAVPIFLLLFATTRYARKNYLICWRLCESYAHKSAVLSVAENLKVSALNGIENCTVAITEPVHWLDCLARLSIRQFGGGDNSSEKGQACHVGGARQKTSDTILKDGTPHVVVNNHVEGGGCSAGFSTCSANIQQMLSSLPKPNTRLRADYKLAEAIIEILASDPSRHVCW